MARQRTSKPMTAETKAKLRARAAELKGYTTLKGLNSTVFNVCLDETVDEGSPHRAVAEAAVRDAGWLTTDRMPGVRPGLLRTRQWGLGTLVEADEPSTSPCPWVRLKHAAPWMHEPLQACLPARRVRVLTWAGRHHVWSEYPVYPAASILALLYLIWPVDGPDRTKPPHNTRAAERVYKYVSGLSDLFVERHPAGGCRIKLKHAMHGPAGSALPGDELTVDPMPSLDGAAAPAWFTACRDDGLQVRVVRTAATGRHTASAPIIETAFERLT